MAKKFVLILFLSAISFGVHAQYEGDEVYDPFADYSEFEENSQEEADINFFRNGRFFNVGLLLGGRMFTGGMAEQAPPTVAPGLTLSFWFNLRLALQFSYINSQHILGPFLQNTAEPNGDQISGTMAVTSLQFDLKYYFNTNNVTRGLADLNPYILVGFSQNYRTFSEVGQTQIFSDDGAGFDLGVGIEIPVARNEMFIGAQFVYNLVTFGSENAPVNDSNDIFLDGDMMNLHLILGFNFL